MMKPRHRRVYPPKNPSPEVHVRQRRLNRMSVWNFYALLIKYVPTYILDTRRLSINLSLRVNSFIHTAVHSLSSEVVK